MKTLTVKVEKDEFTERVGKVFDYDFTGESFFEIPNFNKPDNFCLGLIVGSSGSGKTQIIKNYFGYVEPEIHWDSNKAIVSHFSNPDEAVEKMFAVGLSSIPTICRPFHVLSNGEKFRATVARMIGSDVCIDEFTSVVNRETAKSLSVSLSKYIRHKGLKNVVLVSCHRDIIDWLEPDWVFDCDKSGELKLFENDIDFSNRRKDAKIEIY